MRLFTFYRFPVFGVCKRRFAVEMRGYMSADRFFRISANIHGYGWVTYSNLVVSTDTDIYLGDISRILVVQFRRNPTVSQF